MSVAESIFTEQLIYLLASDGPVTIKKVGKTFVITGKTNTKVTFPENTIPNLTTSYKNYSKK